MNVPVLVITGPVGVGKTTVAAALSDYLEGAGTPHAAIDMDWLRWCRPTPDGDPFHTELGMRNLAAIWRRYRRAGARRLILADVVENREQPAAYERCVPGGAVQVVRLTASATTIDRRLRGRESGSSLEWHCSRARELDALMAREGVGDLVVDTEDRTCAEVAVEIARRAGWAAEPEPSVPQSS